MRSKGKTKSFFADSQKNSFISGASTSVVATPRMRSVRASSLPLFSPNIARQNPTFPASYVKLPARKGQNFSALSSKNSSLIDGLQSKVQSQTNSQFIDKSAVHSGLTINESKPITPQIRSERSSLGKNSFRAAKPHSENLRPTPTENVNTNRFAADPKKLSFGIVAQRLEELKKFNLKLTAIDDYDKPVSIIQDESAKFARTMAFFNKLEGIKKTHVNLDDRTKFARGPIFAKFLNILQDQKIPKFDQENFYVELAAKLREEVNKKNRELRMALEEHIDLKPNEPNEFYLQKSKYRYFSIFVKGNLSPLKITFKDEESLGKITVFVSRTVQKPSNFTAEKTFESKAFKVYDSEKKPTFQCQNLFFAIIADGEGMVTMRFTFGLTETHSNNAGDSSSRNPEVPNFLTSRKKGPNQLPDYVYTAEFAREIRDIQEKRKRKAIRLQQSKGVSIVEHNKLKVKELNPQAKLQTLLLRKTLSTENLQRVLNKKHEIETTRKQKLSFNVIKNDLRVSIRSWSNERAKSIEMKEAKQKSHLMLITCHNMCAGLTYHLNKYKQYQASIKKIKQLVKSWRKHVKNGLLKRGSLFTKRLGTDVLNSLHLYAQFVKPAKVKKSKEITIDYLKLACKAHFLHRKVHALVTRIKKIQMGLRAYLTKKMIFKQGIRINWNMMYPKVAAEFQESHHQKRTSIRFETSEEEGIRNRIVNEFYWQRVADYKAKLSEYMDWFHGLDSDDRKQNEYSKFFITEKKERTRSRGGASLEALLLSKDDPDCYTGYVPTKTKQLPKMFINPTEEELKELIRRAIRETTALNNKNQPSTLKKNSETTHKQ